MNRPYVICHMLMSIDGKVTGDFLYKNEAEFGTEKYYEINRIYKADAFGCGSVTMEGSFTNYFVPDLSSFENVTIDDNDFIFDKNANYYAVCFDRTGRVGWKNSRIYDDDPGYNDCHIIEVVCKKAKSSYLAYLQSIGVSYIFAGEKEMDLNLALKKLHDIFGIKKFMLEGGSIINGAFQREGLIDELSLVQIPLIAGKDSKSLFYDSVNETYKLIKTETFSDGSQWLNYKNV